jgi:hypothetical protein
MSAGQTCIDTSSTGRRILAQRVSLANTRKGLASAGLHTNSGCEA